MFNDKIGVCFDLETTSPDPSKARIVQIAARRFRGDEQLGQIKMLVNPGGKIPPKATEVHKITNEDVADAPKLAAVIDEILAFIEDSDYLLGFNLLRYDIPVLISEADRVGRKFFPDKKPVVDVMRIFHAKHRRDLNAASNIYLGHDLDGAHDAMNDVDATIAVARAMRIVHNDLPESPDDTEALFTGQKTDLTGKTTVSEDGELVWAFGKYKDKRLDTDMKYLQWAIDNIAMPESVKDWLQNAAAKQSRGY